MSKMTWEYLGGFFDGEGCITSLKVKAGYSLPGRIQLSQTQERGRVLLEEIKVFLEARDIVCSVHRADRKGNRKEIHYLYINGQACAMKFMRGIFPYLRIKKLEAQDTMRYLVMFPPERAGIRTRDDTWDMVKDWKSGMSCEQIAEERGLKWATAYARIKNHLRLIARPFKCHSDFATMFT